ncbi:MAG: hypothetical protein ACKOBJ_04650 [Actinomycetota bacterium]
MRRLLWLGVGAAVGVYAYRRGQQWWIDTREQGVTVTVQQLSEAAMSLAATVGRAAQGSGDTVVRARIPGRAAASVVRGGADGLR